MFGEVYRWSEEHDFLVMFVVKDDDGGGGWSGLILSNGGDTAYAVGAWDQWVGQGATVDVGDNTLYWEKVG